MSIYPNLSAEMIRHGYDNKDVAKATGRSDRTVRSWFSGSTDIRYPECMAIKKALFPDMTLEYLFDESPSVASVQVGRSE